MPGAGAHHYNSDIFILQSELMQQDRGAGIASIFSNIYSSVVPIIKSALRIGKKAAQTRAGKKILSKTKKHAMQAGLNVVGDALQGKNIVESTKNELNRVKKSAKNDLLDVLAARPPPAKRQRRDKNNTAYKKKKQKVYATPASLAKRSAKRRQKDIFS